jgi:uncharacterized protein YjiS (DUF1127 family)
MKERRLVALLGERELSELGVSRWEIEQELGRHFCRARSTSFRAGYWR